MRSKRTFVIVWKRYVASGYLERVSFEKLRYNLKKEQFLREGNLDWSRSKNEINAANKNIPAHAVPFPKNPLLQAQVKDPALLAHVAFWWQLWVPSEHSLLSTKSLVSL